MKQEENALHALTVHQLSREGHRKVVSGAVLGASEFLNTWTALLTPCFSWVQARPLNLNRFNGFG